MPGCESWPFPFTLLLSERSWLLAVEAASCRCAGCEELSDWEAPGVAPKSRAVGTAPMNLGLLLPEDGSPADCGVCSHMLTCSSDRAVAPRIPVFDGCAD